MLELLARPWPWWIGGPLLGLIVPLLLLFGGKPFGISSSFRHLVAAAARGKPAYFRYDWRGSGLWNLAFAAGLVLGGLVAATVIGTNEPVGISAATWSDLERLGIRAQRGIAPVEIFAWERFDTLAAWIAIPIGGVLQGFGARWAGGCTSGHAITGLAARQLPSLVAVAGFFAGGMFITYLVLPVLLR